jgi:hypothetical protein
LLFPNVDDAVITFGEEPKLIVEDGKVPNGAGVVGGGALLLDGTDPKLLPKGRACCCCSCGGGS